jgi:putative heme-binding domain-containing protein
METRTGGGRPVQTLVLAIPLLVQAGGLEDRFEIPRGFRIRRVADRDLCGGSYDIAFDGAGRLLVGDGTQVRRLEDRDGDGVFDRFDVVAAGLGPRGPQGLLVFEDRLYAVGGDGLQLFTGGGPGPFARRGRLGAPFSTGGDHAAHQVFRGHDDFLYFIVGDGAGARDRVHITEPSSPARLERACSVFRISPDGARWECVGTGGRNAPNLGMNSHGELFSLDSDMEWHVDLPWWRPVRLHHWLSGGDQGWQNVGAFPPYSIDNLPGICDVGRGSPDWGVFYEHTTFPARYRDAYFVCDYRSKSATSGGYATVGRLLVFFLKRAGAGWSATSEIFAIPKPGARDDQGRPIDFGLVDIEVAPDGSLYLSDHGQGIWRISCVPEAAAKPGPPDDPVEEILALPQPQAEWSRLKREEIRARLGAGFDARLREVAGDPSASVARRLMALRPLASRFEEIPHPFLAKLARDPAPEVRGYAAWLLGLQLRKEGASLLAAEMTRDADPSVRRRALEALARNRPAPDELGGIAGCLEDPERLVRYAAMIALTHHPIGTWFEKAASGGVRSRMRALVAADLRREALRPGRQSEMVRGLLDAVPRGSPKEDRLDLLRVLVRLRAGLAEDRPTHARIARYLLEGEPDPDREVRWEEARLIGEYRLEGGFGRLLGLLEGEKNPVTQFHLAQALARVPGGWSPEEEKRAIEWFLASQRGWFAEFAGKGLEFPAFWSTVLAQFAESHGPALAGAIDRVDLKGLLGKAALQVVAASEGAGQRLVRLYESRPEAGARAPLLASLERVRTPEVAAFLVRELRVLRDDRLRAAALVSLAAQPPTEEARYFLEEGLRHPERDVFRACAGALARQKPPVRPETCRLLVTRLGQRELFGTCERLLVAMSGARREGYRDEADPRRNVGDAEHREGAAFWKEWYRKRFAEEFRPTAGEAERERSNEELRKLLLSEEARGGRADRGRPIYAALCARCHGGTDDLPAGTVLFGPDLTGVTRRLGREEIADSIVFPSKVVAERFRATAVALTDGEVLSGFVTDQDEKTLTLVDAARVHRLDRSRIRATKAQETSLMPELLLNRLGVADVRDLVAFLEEVGSKPEKK